MKIFFAFQVFVLDTANDWTEYEILSQMIQLTQIVAACTMRKLIADLPKEARLEFGNNG